MKRIVSLILALMIVVSLASCGMSDNSKDLTEGLEQRSVPKADEGKTPDFEEAEADFAIELFKLSVANQESKGENVLLSPLSITLALAMTANGAEGETLSDMLDVLGSGMSLEEFNAQLSAYVNKLPEGEKYKLNIANSVWIRETDRIEVKEDFLQTCKDYYNSQVYRAPFDRSTVNDINSWVNDKTDGMIKKLLDGEIDADVMMYLINAICFDAKWAEEYEDHQVRNEKFTAYDGTVRDVKMMSSLESFYLDDGEATGFIKRYAGGKYGFAALLPNEDVSIDDYIASLSGGKLLENIRKAQTVPVNVKLPQFSCDYSTELSNILTLMGIDSAFVGQGADFSNMATMKNSEENLAISRVIHKTFIDVTQAGTRAAAVTAVEMVNESAMEPVAEPREVILDRPFVYMIIDIDSSLPIFIGVVNDITK